jgi:sugar O-acyltransferase (sialic acid O-acetyltransferase NeuD family)
MHVVGFIENMEQGRCKELLEGLPIFWVDEIAELTKSHRAVCGLATTQRSRFTDQVATYGMSFTTLVHPSARISVKSSVGEGSIISVGVILGAHTHLGRHVLVNRGALIGHHTRIDDYVTIQPGANIAGACRIGQATYIGMGAVVIDHVTIGAHAIVGAGAVVTKDVPNNVQVVGVPAKIVKDNIQGK